MEQKAPFKNLVHNGVDFYVQNALKLPTSISNSKIFPGVIPPLKGGGKGEGREGRGKEGVGGKGAGRREWEGREGNCAVVNFP